MYASIDLEVKLSSFFLWQNQFYLVKFNHIVGDIIDSLISLKHTFN